MDLLRLNSTTFTPELLIENYSSLIWTERFVTAGNFEVKTTSVDQGLLDFPERSLFSHMDTKEVMIVENRSISNSSEGYPELTVTGRSLDSFLENRVLTGPYGKTWAPVRAYYVNQLVAALLWNAFVNTSANNILRVNEPHDVLDAIPNVGISFNMPDAAYPAVSVGMVTSGPIYEQILKLLIGANLGLRTIRPRTQARETLTFSTINTSGSLGTMSYGTSLGLSDSLLFDVFLGSDISDTVVFDSSAGHLDDPSYLLSTEKYKTILKIPRPDDTLTNGIYTNISRISGDATLSGLDRRVQWFDPGTPNSDQTLDAFWTNVVPQLGRSEIGQYNKLVLFDGEVSVNTPYVYDRDYELGDIVTLRADYGIEQKMVVQEYTRSETSTEEKRYPGLALWTPNPS